MEAGSYHHGDLRAALVAAGIDLVEQGGIEALTLRAAARAVGVSHAAPARHFADAEAFLAAVATVGYERLRDEMSASAGDADPLQAFRAMGLGYVRFALAHPQWYRVIFHPSLADKAHHPQLLAASDATFRQLRHSVEQAMAAGGVRHDDVGALSLAAWAMVHGIASLLIDGQVASKGYTATDADLAESMLTSLYFGLAPISPPA